jgi:hypothetical protein
MEPFAETERYRIIVEQAGKDDVTMEVESHPTELPTAVGDAIAGLTHCDVTVYRLDEDGDRIDEPVYEERVEDPYEDERELLSKNPPY